MKVIGINGSPRKDWNCGKALDFALQGAVAAGAEIKRYDLFDLNFTGCKSCFGCKLLGGPSFCKCALQDDLTDVLAEILEADALIVSAPIYYSDVPGAVRNFYERILFPANLYDMSKTGYSKRVNVGLIYTMGAPDPAFNGNLAEKDKQKFDMFIGDTEILNILDTYQFDDYSKYASAMFDPVAKRKRNETVFPQDCQKAYEMGKRLVTK